ncbi:MAG: CHAP domain-containing protein [Spirochaetia bacterium]
MGNVRLQPAGRSRRRRPATPSAGHLIPGGALVAFFFAILIVGCATTSRGPFASPSDSSPSGSQHVDSPEPAPVEEQRLGATQKQVVDAAEDLVGRQNLEINGRRFPFDCTGTILAAYYAAGIDLQAEFDRYTGNGVARLYKLSEDADLVYKQDTPRPGDVIFWDNTYDRNGDGRWNDSLTHAGIVIRGYEDGSVDYVHHDYNRGVVVARMNIDEPDVHTSDDTLVNSPMRMRRDRHIKPSQWLAGHLYRSGAELYRL